jgi:Zn-dependent peptidase ImmA (M78 family)
MIKINGETWRIFLVSPNHPILYTNGSYTLGACDNVTHSIYINENLNSHKMKKVLCHELTHAAMFSYDVELTLEQEELLADLLATYGQEIVDMTNEIFIKLKRNIY